MDLLPNRPLFLATFWLNQKHQKLNKNHHSPWKSPKVARLELVEINTSCANLHSCIAPYPSWPFVAYSQHRHSGRPQIASLQGLPLQELKRSQERTLVFLEWWCPQIIDLIYLFTLSIIYFITLKTLKWGKSDLQNTFSGEVPWRQYTWLMNCEGKPSISSVQTDSGHQNGCIATEFLGQN